jgi:GST-like protein
MTYVLYGEPGSGSAIPEAMLAEIGAPVRLVDLDVPKGEHRRPPFLAVNPLGRVPALVLPGGEVVTESAAILLVLDERHPEAGLMPPPGTAERARLLRWLMVSAGDAYGAVGRWDFPGRFTTDPAGEAGVREAARAELRRLWRVVEERAAPDPFLLGARFTAVDLHLAALCRWHLGEGWLAAECPRVERLARSVAARPAVAPVWARHFG